MTAGDLLRLATADWLIMTDHIKDSELVTDELTNDIIEAYREKVARLLTEIEELKDGSCRFRCRTEKQAFIEGYMADSQCGEHSRIGAERAWRSRSSIKNTDSYT